MPRIVTGKVYLHLLFECLVETCSGAPLPAVRPGPRCSAGAKKLGLKRPLFGLLVTFCPRTRHTLVWRLLTLSRTLLRSSREGVSRLCRREGKVVSEQLLREVVFGAPFEAPASPILPGPERAARSRLESRREESAEVGFLASKRNAREPAISRGAPPTRPGVLWAQRASE